MSSAGASDSDRQIRLAFTLILRQQVVKQIREAPYRLLDFGLILQVLDHAPIRAGKWSKILHKERIRKMAHVEQQFHFSRRAEAMTKAQDLHAKCNGFAFRAEPIEQKLSQRMNRMIRCVDYFVS